MVRIERRAVLANYWITDRIAEDCSTLSPAGISGESGFCVIMAGNGVGFSGRAQETCEKPRDAGRIPLQDISGMGLLSIRECLLSVGNAPGLIWREV